MQWTLIGMVALAGMALPFQAGMNATLAARADSGYLAALVNFSMGALMLALIVSLSRQWGAVSHLSLAHVPWWAWGGGAIGAFSVFASLKAAPVIGAATLIGVIVTAQMAMSLLIDHFGWAGYPQQSITLSKLVGVGLLIAGVFLLRR